MKKLHLLIVALLLSTLTILKADTIAAYRDAVTFSETSNSAPHWGQTFTAESTGALDTITVWGRTATGVVPDELTFFIYDVVDSSTLSLLGSSTITPPALTTTSKSPISASFLSDSIVLTAGHLYAFGLFYDSFDNADINYELSHAGYTGGSVIWVNDAGTGYSTIFTNATLSFSVTGVSAVPDSTDTAALLAGAVIVMAWWQLRLRRQVPAVTRVRM